MFRVQSGTQRWLDTIDQSLTMRRATAVTRAQAETATAQPTELIQHDCLVGINVYSWGHFENYIIARQCLKCEWMVINGVHACTTF